MSPEHITLQQALTAERARLLDLLWQDIVALRQLVNESQQLMDAARPELHSRAIGTAAVPLPPAEQDASA
jgi:hypothetical protein